MFRDFAVGSSVVVHETSTRFFVESFEVKDERPYAVLVRSNFSNEELDAGLDDSRGVFLSDLIFPTFKFSGNRRGSKTQESFPDYDAVVHELALESLTNVVQAA